MLNKLLIIVVIIELFTLIFISPQNIKNIKYKHSINIYKISDINKAKLENYVIGVVAAEMPATFSLEALKAQAVAARTFAYKKIINNKLNFDDLINDKGQAYLSNEEMKHNWKEQYDEYYNKISGAVLSTKGEVLTFNGDIIYAYYFSISNGKTENSSEVFGEKSYLVSVESPWDTKYSSFEKTINININEFKEKLNINGRINIDEIKYSDTNHVEYIIINNKKYSGVEFRKLLNLRSTDFSIEIDNDYVYINTKGYGHGVGMSQYGANSMAIEGKMYKEILKYYYNGVEILKI